jgi:hypothetical protein
MVKFASCFRTYFEAERLPQTCPGLSYQFFLAPPSAHAREELLLPGSLHRRLLGENVNGGKVWLLLVTIGRSAAMSNIFVWSTIILAIWGAVGPLFGIRYGQELAKRWQRQHWVNDNAKQECRELISTMADTFTVQLKYYAKSSGELPISGPHSETEMREHERAFRASLEIFYSRLFISDELVKLKTRDRWIASLRDYKEGGDKDKFAREFGALVEEVRNIAQGFID